MNEHVIDIAGVGMNFGKFPALCGIDLRVKRGSAMALLGENGAGKTTTLRILTSLYRASHGSGSVLGEPLGCDHAAFFQRIGYVSENQRLPLRWTLQGMMDYLRPQYEWRQMRERGYHKTVKEWKKETQLVCEVVDNVEPLILPVDIEVEVPDPVKVRDLLLEGKL